MKDKEEVIIDGKAWVERYKSAYNAQANWRELWNDCRRYVMPQDAESYSLTESKTEGERRAYPVNSTAVDLCEKMASGMHSATVSYGDRWFTLTSSGGGELMSRWCSQATRLCIHAMQESNYLSASSDMIKYFCAYGTAILFIGEGEDGLPKYRNIPVTNNVCIETDEYGEANIVYVGYFYTARQAVSMFGENAVSPAIRNAYRAELKTGNVGKKFEFIHVTYPKKLFNEPVEAKRAALTRADELEQLSEEYRPWGGLFIEKDTGGVVRREGFHEFPFVVPRFMLSNDESYGRSIPMLAMPTIKTLNEAMAVMIDASKMAVRPPIGVPTSLPKLDLRPGAITKVNMSAAAQIWTYTTQASIPVGEKLIELLTNELRSMFKEDFFMAVTKRGEMSATEVAERVRQASEFISPIVMNLQHFGFRPAVMRTLAILERSKRIPKRPDTGGTFDISFVSRIDSMIRQSESSRIMQFLQQAATVGQLTAANPDLQNVVDLDKVYDELAVAMGVDASIIFDVGRRMESRAAQAQAQAEAMRQQMQAEMMAKTDMTKSIDPNSILGQMDEAA
ncbi:MAG: hypothetical protein IJV91_02435 [Kiritimatiellae bacterium]|nr:hypothetical protein [Kiritimatiellia bacterium]